MSDKWIEISKAIVDSSRSEQLRWRKTPVSILKGEASSMLNMHGMKAYDSSVLALEFILRAYSNSPELFYLPEEGDNGYSAGLGKVLYSRVRGLADEDKVANGHLKTWVSSDQETLLKLYLPRLFEYNRRARRPVRIPLPALLSVLASWDVQRDRHVTAITAEYFNAKRSNDPNKGDN